MRQSKPPTPEQIKAAADRAQARSDGIADESVAPEKAFADPMSFEWPEAKGNGDPIKASMMNVLKAIELLGLSVRYDVFRDVYTVGGDGMGTFVGDLNDQTVRKFRELCFEKLMYDPGKEASFEGIQRACEENKYNSILDYLTPLKWDNVPRLKKWLTTYLGVTDTPLHRAWGRKVIMAAVRRAHDPGCKFDHVLSLEGLEGEGKSTAVKVLACGKGAEERPDNFSDSTILDKDERSQMELTKAVWFYELSEMAGAAKADQKKLKAFVVRQEERARAAYAHFPTKQPRICIFIASVNVDANTGEVIEYLNPGDRRRWWPVRVGIVHPIDIEGLIRDRDQLFAEAMSSAFDEFGEPQPWESLALDSSLWKEAETVQVEREITDPVADKLSTLYGQLSYPLADKATRLIDRKHSPVEGSDYILGRDEVWVSAKFVTELVPGNTDTRRIAAAMGGLGWKRVKDRRTGEQMRGYVHARADDGRSAPEPEPADDSDFA